MLFFRFLPGCSYHSITKMCIMNEHVLVADHFRFLVSSHMMSSLHTDVCFLRLLFSKLLFFLSFSNLNSIMLSNRSIRFVFLMGMFWMRKQHVTTVFLVAFRWWPRERKNTTQKKKLRSRRQIGDESSCFFSTLHMLNVCPSRAFSSRMGF